MTAIITPELRAKILREEAEHFPSNTIAAKIMRDRADELDPRPNPRFAKIGDVWSRHGTLHDARIKCVKGIEKLWHRPFVHLAEYLTDEEMREQNYKPVDLQRFSYQSAVRAACGEPTEFIETV